MKVKFFDIQWDTDGDGFEDGLPQTVFAFVPDTMNVDMEGADFLSDQYDYCVFGFDYEVQE